MKRGHETGTQLVFRKSATMRKRDASTRTCPQRSGAPSLLEQRAVWSNGNPRCAPRFRSLIAGSLMCFAVAYCISEAAMYYFRFSNVIRLRLGSLGTLVALTAGLWFFFGRQAVHLWKKATLHDFRLCPACGYVLDSSVMDHLCPECGVTYNLDEVRSVWITWCHSAAARPAGSHRGQERPTESGEDEDE